MRTFNVVRHEDVTGVSGIGVVAEGVEFHDGTVAFRWRGLYRSTVLWDSIKGVVAVHGHDGRTEFRPTIIECPTCQMMSKSRADIDAGYCGNCKEFTSIGWNAPDYTAGK